MYDNLRPIESYLTSRNVPSFLENQCENAAEFRILKISGKWVFYIFFPAIKKFFSQNTTTEIHRSVNVLDVGEVLTKGTE